MSVEFPGAVPEIPVSNVDEAAEYYKSRLGFTLDWGGESGGIAGISKGHCRMFLTNPAFRQSHGNSAPVLIWLNLGSREEVNELHHLWSRGNARLVSAPESKPWKLYEFIAADLDGNLLRVFYDFAWESK
jgi:predicted lactoylglutathione lyase